MQSSSFPLHRLTATRDRQIGLTLIELLVALALGLLIVAAAIASLIVARQGYRDVDGSTQLRQYSLCDAPHPQHLRISVKRERLRQRHGRSEPAGQVSNWLHDHVTPGSILQVTHPFGDFRPDVESERPIVLLSAGVGITPMIAVLNRIAQVHPMREVIFAHAARSSVQHAHRADLANAAAIMPNLRDVTFYETHSGADLADGKTFGGRMLLSALPAWDHAAADVYLCGPVEFMQAQWRALLDAGVPASRLHREVFGPELLDFLN